MTAYELLLAIKDYSEGDVRETIEQSNELLSNLMGNKMFTVNFSNEIEEFSLLHFRCPNCASKLYKIKIGNEQSEYCGKVVTEDIYEVRCNECSYIRD